MKYIKHGYRAHRNMDACKCTKSLFTLHNETLSIWTHLLATIYFMYQIKLVYLNEGAYQEVKERNNHYVLIAGLMCCTFSMLTSTIYHMFNSISRVVYLRLLRVDLMGIGIMIFGLAISLIYTGFHNY